VAAVTLTAAACGQAQDDPTGDRNTVPETTQEPEPPSGQEGGGAGESSGSQGPVPLSEPVYVDLAEVHTFDDGLSVGMGPVERRTGPPGDPESPSPSDDAPEEGLPESGAQGDGATSGSGEDAAASGPSGAPSEGSPAEEAHYAWTVAITNGTDQPVHSDSLLTACAVGDPLRRSRTLALGDPPGPPRSIEPGRTASWDEGCAIGEDDDGTLQWTLEFFDGRGTRLRPPLVFTGEVGRGD
jgi:hypothetical protein